MTAQLSFTAIFESVDGGWVQAYIRELPGVITAAPSRDEARELLLDALAEYIKALAAEDGSWRNEGVASEPVRVAIGL